MLHASFFATRSQYFLLFAAAFLAVGALTPLFRRIAINHNIWDAPVSQHKTHRQPVPYLGGVAIAIGIIAVTYASIGVKGQGFHNLFLATTILLPAAFIGFIGLMDDIQNLSALSRFIAQSIAGVIISFILIAGNNVGTPTGNRLIDGVVTTLWVVGITNSINFFDNLDGGAAGTVGVSSVCLAILAYLGHQYLIAGMSTVISGAMVGFLLWNKSPARIYMGDAGALFLGVLMATLTVRLHPSAYAKWASFATPIFLLAIPILDTTVAVTSRVKRGISPFQGGQDHLSHRLIRLGIPRKTAAIILWCASGVFGLFAILIPQLPHHSEFFIVGLGATLWVGLYLFFSLQADS